MTPTDENSKKFEAPNSLESEVLVLGMMLNSLDALNLSVDALEGSDFYTQANQLIFGALKSFLEKDRAVDEHLLIEELKANDLLERVGGVGYIKYLNVYSECYSNVQECIKIIKDYSTLRRLSSLGSDLHVRSMQTGQDPVVLIEEIQKKIFQVSQGINAKSGVLIKDILSGKSSRSGKSFIEEVEERQRLFIETKGLGVPFDGVRTGFLDLDKIIGGFGNSHLIIVAARPGMGKTALALAIAEDVSLNQNIGVGLFSLEMHSDELVGRMISSHAKIEKSKVTTGNLSGSEFQCLYVSSQKLNKINVVIDDQSKMRIGDLRVRARRMKEAHSIGILIIDYLQLISGSNSYKADESRQVEVAEISRNLKILAKELHIPIVCLAQLNRKVEDRADKKPVISDLRESGSLEQDADCIILLSRADMYDQYTKPGLAQLNVAKNRHGPVGDFQLCYLKQYARFENYTPLLGNNYDQFSPG